MTARVATVAWCASSLPAWWRYRRALDAPSSAQRRLLVHYIRRNADTAFGRAHGFARIRTIADYQARVPLASYEQYEPLVRRIAQGERRVLTAEPVTRLAVTSGSTSAAKLVPYTATLHAEIARAVGAWAVDLYRAWPQIAGGPAFWSVTPAVRPPVVPNARVPIGFEEDSRYLGGLSHRLVDAAMAVPGSVRQIGDHETHRYVTLLCLLRARELRLISVWHPSYLTLLLDALRTHWDALIADIRRGEVTAPQPLPGHIGALLHRRRRPDIARAEELRAAGPDACNRLWPRLGLVSCWGDAAARHALDDLRQRLPGVRLQPKGLLATEAIVTLPLGGRRPLAICSHFFEFIDAGDRVRLAHELEAGATYGVAVTTGGGLYRYLLGDRVQVDGSVGRTPSLRFVGRDAQVSDRVGEKLHESFVATVIERLFASERPPRFAMLAPDRTPEGVSYTLFVETDAALSPDLPHRLEAALSENPHYALAVGLRQLAPSRLVCICEGFQAFARHSIDRGQRLGDLKPVALHREEGWSKVFAPARQGTSRQEWPCRTH